LTAPTGWRFAALVGAASGVALAPAAPVALDSRGLAAIGAGAAVALLAVRPRGAGGAQATWLACLATAAACLGLAIGEARLAAIDAGAFADGVGRQVVVRGVVAAVPRRSEGTVAVRVETAAGRLMVEASEPVPDLPIGREVKARGTLREPGDWELGYLRRYGIAQVLEARDLRLTGGRRGGAPALVDAIRDRAEVSLGRGTPGAEAALLRGFVLGEDDRIDPATIEDFKRSGLAHLLAVSGENVMLLGLLAAPLLGLLGVPLRARLLCILALIAVYVPVTGAGPSIQRAGVMGAAGVVAALAGRPRSRWYAVLLAAFATLVLNPRASGDPGWQLSFAAVVGILVWAPPLRDLLLGGPASGARRPVSGLRRAVAEGASVTIAATLATAPLFSAEFGAVSPASLPANLLALPAVAPVMWLGMLAAIAGQVPGLPVEPLTGLAGLLAAYVAQVAHWLARPGWAQVRVSLPGAWGVAVAYLVLGAGMAIVRAAAQRRMRALRPRAGLGIAAVAVCLGAWLASGQGQGGSPGERAPGLRVTVEDVGQGDAILLDPRGGPAILVDCGPPGDALAADLRSEGVGALAATLVTHDQVDHAGGLADLLSDLPVHAVIHAAAAPDALRAARAARVRTVRVAEGSEVDSADLRVEVLWPPRALLDGAAPGDDPNLLSLVLMARWHGFAMLLTGDAEAEAVPIDPGGIDVLKVAHHGSDDAGLGALLDRTAPALAVISVGAGNPYGHPTPSTLATLARHGVPVLRTDQEGDVTIDVSRTGFSVTG
jgi:competence protein ComEC